MEKRIQSEIDETFDDERFLKMDPDSRIDASFCRKEYGKNRPEVMDYLLWSAKFVTHCDIVKW